MWLSGKLWGVSQEESQRHILGAFSPPETSHVAPGTRVMVLETLA